MPSHPEFVGAFRAGLASGGLPPGLTARAPEEAERRFAVYRNNVAHGLITALRQRFPVVERLVGAEFFGAMARVFVEAHPPETPVLMEYGAAFPGFLEGFPPAAGLPYLGDVARLELARGRAYHAADAAPVALDALAAAAQADPEGLRLRLHPSAGLIASRWPVVSIWRANQPGADARVTATGTEYALVSRQDLDVVFVRAIDAAEYRFLQALMTGHGLGAAAAAGVGAANAAFDPSQPLARLIAEGLIVGAQQGETR
jgi:hypothetical protein